MGSGVGDGYWVTTGHYQWALDTTGGHWVLPVDHWVLLLGNWALLVGHWALLVGHWTLVLGTGQY